jgi:hypothetical protein
LRAASTATRPRFDRASERGQGASAVGPARTSTTDRIESARARRSYPPSTIAAPEVAPQGTSCGLQNTRYTYDPAGNVTRIVDQAQQTRYFRNKRVAPGNDYTYDALYRLIQATGREHLGQKATGIRNAPTAPGGDNAFHTGLAHPGDGKAMGGYIERYVYDAVGNFVEMQHRGSDPANAGWTRAYAYSETSLIEDGSGGTTIKKSNRLAKTTLNPNGAPIVESYRHDPHGNVVRLPHLGGASPAATEAPCRPSSDPDARRRARDRRRRPSWPPSMLQA